MWIAVMIATVGLNWGLFLYYIIRAIKAGKQGS